MKSSISFGVQGREIKGVLGVFIDHNAPVGLQFDGLRYTISQVYSLVILTPLKVGPIQYTTPTSNNASTHQSWPT